MSVRRWTGAPQVTEKGKLVLEAISKALAGVPLSDQVGMVIERETAFKGLALPRASLGGTVAQLVKKGLIGSSPADPVEDAPPVVWLSKTGVAWLQGQLDGAKMVTRRNLMSGKEYQERADTPAFMSPSRESYWSM